MLALGQQAVGQQAKIAAGQRILPVGEGGLDIEPTQPVIRNRERPAIDRDLDPLDSGPGERPAADLEVAADRHVHDAADHVGGIEMQFPLGVAGRLRAAFPLRVFDRQDRQGDFVHLPALAEHLECD
jgi:hypothetical protein